MSKKLQLGTPIRFEYLVTNTEWLTGEDGIAVENTQALHFSAETKKPNLLVQGRIDNNSWIVLEQSLIENNHVTVDVSKWERVRYSSGAIGDTIRVIAYTPSFSSETITVAKASKEFLIDVDNNQVLHNIHSELEKLNIYMSILTGEKL